MKTYLVFNTNGDIYEKELTLSIFDIKNFPDFSNYKTYDRYIILYNDENEENITIFPFTSDKYFGNVGLILLNKHDKIIKLNLEMYSKKLKCDKYAQNEMYFSSDSDSDFI